MLRAGAMQVCITPPIGVELAGYGPDLGRNAIDIHDDLMAQALVIEDGDVRVALIASDLIDMTAEFTASVRDEVQRQTGIPAGNVMVWASHSHTSVSLFPFRSWGNVDRQYARMAARLLAGAAVAAAHKLAPAKISVGAGTHTWLAWNRVGTGIIDPTADVIRVDAADGKPIALLAHYGCHPVILGPRPVISADYPGALRRYLAGQFPGSVVMFANGTCGDVDPITNKAGWGSGNFDDVDEAGRRLGEDVKKIALSAKPIDPGQIKVRQSTIELGFNVPTLKAVRADIKKYAAEARKSRGKDERFEAVTGEVTMPRFWLAYNRMLEKRLTEKTQPTSETAELQAIAFGRDAALVAIPAEVYASQGLAMRAASPFKHTLVIGYANASVGYIPPREEFEKGSYGVGLGAAIHGHVPFQPDVAEVAVNGVKDLLKEVK